MSPPAAGDARPGWSSHAIEQPGDRTVPERDVVHAARLGRRTEGARSAASRERRDKTAAQASTRAAISPTLSWLDWRRAFGPLLSWWVLPIPLAAAAIAAVAWITSLVVRRPSRRGVPPLAIFEPEGPVIAPLPRRKAPAACGVTNFKPPRMRHHQTIVWEQERYEEHP